MKTFGFSFYPMRLLTALLFLAGLVQPLSAQQDSNSRRLTLRSDTLSWEAVGRVDIGSSGFCTGVLLRPNIVMTAAHCLFDADTSEKHDPTTLVFKAGLRDENAVATRTVKRAVLHTKYIYNDKDRRRGARYGVALLQLSQPIAADQAAPFGIKSFAGLGNKVSVVSYATEHPQTLSWQKSCNVVGRQGRLIAFTCDVSFGSSGALIFDLSGRRAQIVSIVSNSNSEEDGTASFGMEISGVVKDLFAILPPDTDVFPSEPVVAKRLRVGNGARKGGAHFVRP